MPNPGPHPGDYDDLDAFDAFDGDDSYRNTAQESDALDLFDTEAAGTDQSFADQAADQAALDAVDEDFESDDELATNDTDAALESIDSVTETIDDDDDQEDEDGAQLFSVVNPLNTVKVSAHIDGSTFRVKLAPKALNQNDAELAEEIVVLAALAQQKGRAGQHQYLFDNADQIQGLDALSAFGMDSKQVLKAVAETGMRLPTPEKAATAQAEVFAARYQQAP